MRNVDYLRDDRWTLNQRILFERQRLAVISMASRTDVNLVMVAKVIGLYESQKVLEALRLDGYLTRFHHKPSGETRYRINNQAINTEAFFMSEKYPKDL